MSAADPYGQLVEAARAQTPDLALVLGSGLGQLAQRIYPLQSVPFDAVPGLQVTSIDGHPGRITLGDWAGRRLLVFEGRLHYYECGNWPLVLAPVRTANSLGAPLLVMTNAAGGIHDALAPGSLMVLRDHIEWTKRHAWRQNTGPNGASPYSVRLRQVLLQAGRNRGIPLLEGVYAAVTGPCYETPAEIRALRTWGADAVGMSTAREIQAAHRAGLECAAISLITNRAAGLSSGPISHEEVLAMAEIQANRLAELLEAFLHLL